MVTTGRDTSKLNKVVPSSFSSRIYVCRFDWSAWMIGSDRPTQRDQGEVDEDRARMQCGPLSNQSSRTAHVCMQA
eukprot:SAG31_NODE_25011_length_470_cov_0.498652_1_plen_74_part_10